MWLMYSAFAFDPSGTGMLKRKKKKSVSTFQAHKSVDKTLTIGDMELSAECMPRVAYIRQTCYSQRWRTSPTNKVTPTRTQMHVSAHFIANLELRIV